MFDFKSNISFYRPLFDSISFRSGKVAKLAIKYLGKGKTLKVLLKIDLHLLFENVDDLVPISAVQRWNPEPNLVKYSVYSIHGSAGEYGLGGSGGVGGGGALLPHNFLQHIFKDNVNDISSTTDICLLM
jgi:hypothetical protein